jgi:DnaJ-class molecular chaperone
MFNDYVMDNDFNLFALPPNATLEDLQKRFRSLAKIHHPDRKSGNSEKFKELNNAYSRLEEKIKNPRENIFQHLFSDFAESIHQRSRCVEVTITIEELFVGKTIWLQNKKLNIPPGLVPNTILTIPELNIEVLLRVAKHNYYSIEPRTMNLMFRTSISLYEALVGYTGKIKHPNGSMLYLYSPKDQVVRDGQILTCKFKGIPLSADYPQSTSDFVVVFNVIMPVKIDSDKYRILLRQVFDCNVPAILRRPSDIDVQLA